MTGTLPPRFDAFAPEVLDDPYPTYARLRASGALSRGGPATWVVTRHADVSSLLRDPRLGHTFPEDFRVPFATDGGPANQLLQQIVSSLDPPQHTRVRRVVARAVSPVVVRGLRPRLNGWIEEILAAVRDSPNIDAVGDVALPMQISVGCGLLDIPPGDRAEVWPRAVAIGRAFIPMAMGSPPADDGTAKWLSDYVRGLVTLRRRQPGDDVISRMIQDRTDGAPLDDDEIADNAVFLLFAGFETAIYLIAAGCVALTTHPDEQRRLRADPTLVSSAVEEFVRFDPPIQSMARMVLAPIQIEGRSIRPGRALLMLIGSANRDERVFADPDRLNVGRQPNPHLGFGGGAHHCLGVGLARLEGEIVFNRLLRHYAVIEAAAPPLRRAHPNLRGFHDVPLSVKPL